MSAVMSCMWMQAPRGLGLIMWMQAPRGLGLIMWMQAPRGLGLIMVIANILVLGVYVHQSSGVNPLLYAIVVETISRDCRVDLLWELLYADDLIVK